MILRILRRASLLSLVLAFLLPQAALAHSRLTRSTPTAGAQLGASPPALVLVFSEGAQLQFSSFVVLDRARKHYETAQAPILEAAQGQVTVPLQPNLPAGAYTVQWKVVSAVDGHLTRGSFIFTMLGPTVTPPVGAGATAPPSALGSPVPAPPTPTAAALPPVTGDPPPPETTAPGLLDIVVRGLGFALAAVPIGGSVFSLWVVPRGLASLSGLGADRERFARRFARGALISSGVLLLTLGLEVLLEGARVTDSTPLAVLGQPTVLGGVLAGNLGFYLLVRLALTAGGAALLLAALRTRRLGRPLWLALAGLGLAYFGAETASGHAAALSQNAGGGLLQAIVPYVNVVHLLATAVWIGGIFYFVGVLLPLANGGALDSRRTVLRDTIARFSPLALGCVIVLVISGSLNYLAEQPSVASTLATEYGRAVIAKVVLLAVLAIPAAYNLRRVGPGLGPGRGAKAVAATPLIRRFGRAVRLEAALLGAVLIAAAVLTLSAPATDPANVAADAGATPLPATSPTLTAALSPTTSMRAPTAVAVQPTLPTTALSTTLTLSQTVQGVDVALTTIHAATDDLIVGLRAASGPIPACAATPSAGADCTLSVKVTITEIDDNTSDTEVAAPLPGGGYAVPTGPYLALDGNWQIVVAVRRYNQPEDVEVAFRYVVNGPAMAGKIGDYVHVRVQTDPSPPRSGPVQLRFHLTDEQGRPVNDATVQMQGIMAAHGHVSELVPLHSVGGGDYTGALLLQMSGGWGLDLTIQRAGRDPTVAEVGLDVDKSDYDLTPYPSPNITPAGR